MGRILFHRLVTKKITIAKWQLNFLLVSSFSLGVVFGIYFLATGVVLPKIFASTGYTYTIGSAGSTQLTDGTGSGVIVTASNVTLDKNSNWFNINWNYRRQLTIYNYTGNNIVSGTPVTVTIDTSSLQSVQSSCNDIRIAYQQTTEITRYVQISPGATGCTDSKATQITFQLQSAINSGATSTDYYLYYGNTSATAPSSTTSAFNFGTANALMVCPFNGTTTCDTGQTPLAATGTLRYSGLKTALEFNGYSDDVVVPQNLIGSQGTIEMWVYYRSLSGLDALASQSRQTSDGNDGMHLGNNYGSFYFQLIDPTGGQHWVAVTGGSVPTNTWVHIAATWQVGQVEDLFINGVEYQGTSVLQGTPVTAGNFRIGYNNESNSYANVIIDEVRVSNIVRYTSNFTPSTSPFLRDSNTELLYHFDANGSDPRNPGIALDDSGNGYNGTINGATYVSGLVGVDNPTETGEVDSQSYDSHTGLFSEEGVTNYIENPSFENNTYNYLWSADSALTVSKNTTAPYYKFGSTSAKVVGSTTTSGNFYTTFSPTSDNGQELSAYVYNGTTGSVGGNVDSTVASLYSTVGSLTTTYTNEGGGWWRLTSPITFPYPASYADSYTNSDQDLLYSTSNNFLAQPFIPSNSVYINKLTLYLKKVGNLDSEYSHIEIQTDNGGVPSGSPVTNGTSACFWDHNVYTGYSDMTFTFSTPPSLTSGTKYYLVLKPYTDSNCTTADTTADTSNYLVWGYNNAASYSGGNRLVADNTGTWTSQSGQAQSFTIHGYQSSYSYGVTIPSNSTARTVYIDGAQLEDLSSYDSSSPMGWDIKNYATTYADGSLGSGYSWSGTPNASTSVRQSDNLYYSPTSNIQASAGTLSIWVDPMYNHGTQDWGWNRTDGYIATGAINSNSGLGFYRSNDTKVYCYVQGAYIASTAGAMDTTNHWYNLVLTWNNGSFSCYINGTSLGTSTYSSAPGMSDIMIGNMKQDYSPVDHASAIFSDLLIYDSALTSTDITSLYYSGLSGFAAAVSSSAKYNSSGTWTSPVINIGAAGWGTSPNFLPTETLNGDTITYETRTSADNITWTSYQPVTGTDPNYAIASSAQRYVQILATLNSPSQTTTPTLSDMSIDYVTDVTPPTTNASAIVMDKSNGGTQVPSNGWTNQTDPYFSWAAGADNTGGSGIKGYCLYLGTDPSGDPATSKGLLGTSPVSTVGTTCQFIISTTNIDLATSAYQGSTWLTTSSNPYYLNIKAVDNSGNIYTGSSAQFEFYFDNIAPTNVTYISAPSQSYSNVADMLFSWPTSGSSAATDSNAGVLGYQYQINSTTGTWEGTQTSSYCNLSYIPASTSSYQLTQSQDGSSISVGSNTVYFRTVDQSCNVSSPSTYRSANLQYGGAAPVFSNGSVVTATPSSNTTNSYALSWPAALATSGKTITHYYYMVNTNPPSDLATLQGNSSVYIDNGTSLSVSAKALANVNKGTNTVYVVAIDDNTTPDYSPSNYVKGTFTLNSTNPDPVQNLVATDSSIKDKSQWNVTLTWTAGSYQGAGNLTYKVYRSTDNTTFTNVGSTSGLSYVDNTPASTLYYYYIVTEDGANATSSNSTTVSITPTGRYTSPATLQSGPTVANITSEGATIEWSTDRNSDSKIAYGISSGNYYTTEPYVQTQVTSHSVTLNNLTPGTTYYYTSYWTDVDGNTGSSSEESFTTLPPPSVSGVKATNITLDSAYIEFTISNATQATVEYGTTTSYGGAVTVTTSTSQSTYSVPVTNLQDGTNYHYRIEMQDSSGTNYYSDDYTDLITLPRPKITDVRMSQVVGTAQPTVLVSWATNTGTTSIATYYPQGSPDEVRNVVNVKMVDGAHEILLKGLNAKTTYTLIVKGVDKLGNEAVSDTQTFTTATDTRPPEVTNMAVQGKTVTTGSGTSQSNNTQLVVTWDTDKLATSQVEYGEGTGNSYNEKTQADDNYTYNHLVVISNLNPSTVYHLRALSVDNAGNVGKSIDTVTITPKSTNTALNLVISNLQQVFGFLGALNK